MPCVLFGAKYPGGSRLQNFYLRPFRCWKDALRSFRKHAQNSDMHKYCACVLKKFITDFAGKTLPIDKGLDVTYRAEVKTNREAIAPIVDTIILCGRQNFPLRGHNEKYQKDQNKDQDIKIEDINIGQDTEAFSLNNPGNFVELLNFRIRGGDMNLKNHLQNSAKNAQYTSPESQNSLIKCCGEIIRNKIIKEVKESKYFAILGDEATDCSMNEQIALILRFVDQK